jgi:3-hydroxyisobutyrate dehydrogenase-like beta-hydroxyacid dehydrogenase
MTQAKIGFIGFGEVGYTFSCEMNEHGADITAYDILLNDPERADELEKRILDSNSKIGTFNDVVLNSTYILSTVVTQAALEVAKLCSSFLRPGQIFLDLNSTSPIIKVEIGQIIEKSGADFVEGAILGAVGATGAETPIFTGGVKAQEVTDLLNRLGMNTSYFSPTIGKASTFKMLRSIFSKGVEVLLLEMMIAGRKAGIDEDLWKDVTNFISSKPFDEIAANWIESHAVAHKRRYYEMLQVVETMKDLGVEPIMTERTAAFFKQSIDMGMESVFPVKPTSIIEVIDYLVRNKEESRTRGKLN